MFFRGIIGSAPDGVNTDAVIRYWPDGWPQATTVGYANEGLTRWLAPQRNVDEAFGMPEYF
jgi:hypothetical protein